MPLSKCAAVLFLAAIHVASVKAEAVKKGGKTVEGCRCLGPADKGGECGYHMGGWKSDTPWCYTKDKCGKSAMSGYYMECSIETIERRRAPDGKFYNAKEFSDYFKGTSKAEWDKAAKRVERRLANNNKAYSAKEFRAYYIDALGEKGWADEWKSAREEKRGANDGKWYTFDEFKSYYGANAMNMWESAWKPDGRSEKDVDGCQCAGANVKGGLCGYHIGGWTKSDKPWCYTANKCGTSGMTGFWMECDKQTVERRRADDGKLYDSKEFDGYFGKGSKEKWAAAARAVEKRLAGDNKAYSVKEFRAYYIDSLGEKGWAKKWHSATEESRQADDGKWYTYAEFASYYGASAWKKWQAAWKSVNEEL